MKIIPGRHKCGREMNMRIADIKDDDNEVISWIIYGVCKKCKVVLISDILLQPEQPIQDRDFLVDYDKISDEVKHEKNL